jgi:hypothetical protein
MTDSPWPAILRAQFRGQQAPALRIDCPHCKATAGQPCRGPSNRKLHQPHRSREEAAGVVARPAPREAS